MQGGHRTRIVGLLALLGLSGVVLAARAQSANCESFKQQVATSIEAKGIQDYSLEFVPRREPLPPGARAVGNCDGGAYTLLYRRGAAAAAARSVAEAASRPAAQPGKPPVASRAVGKAAAATTTPAAAASEPAPAPAHKPDAGRGSPPAVAAPAVPAAALPAPQLEAASAPVAPTEPKTTPVSAGPGAAAMRPVDAPPSTFDVVARRMAWAVAGLLLAVFVVRQIRRWQHRRYYDDAGLPRGPRITL